MTARTNEAAVARSAANLANCPPWLQPGDELPHAAPDLPLWNETYLDYGFSVPNQIGFWVHLRHVPQAGFASGIWDIVAYLALPDDEFVVARIDAPGEWEKDAAGKGKLRIAGLSWYCEQPFERWTKRLRGAGRRVSGAELRAGPLKAGSMVPFSLEYRSLALTPPWDHEKDRDVHPRVDSGFYKFHFEQHFGFEGQVTIGNDVHPIAGDGLRDHSWGPRDWSGAGHATWMHGRSRSGKCFSLTVVTDAQLKPRMIDPKVGNAQEIHFTHVENPPVALSIAQAHQPFECTLYLPDGTPTTLRGETVASIPMHFYAPSEFVFGAGGAYSPATHDYVAKFVRMNWLGEEFYGYDDRCIRRLP